MIHWLGIAALALTAIGFLLYVGTYCLPPLRRREDEFRTLARVILTLAGAFWVVGGFFEYRRTGNTWVLMRRALFFAVLIFTMWGRSIAGFIVSPLINLFDGGSERPDKQPLYSTAESLRRKGRIREAMYAIQEEMQKFPNDFHGQMLLAEIQVENANDLPGAEATIHRICSQPKHTPGQIAGALTTLADWHLRYDQDVDAAREALQQIVERFPETELADRAANRLGHLAEASTLVDARELRTIVMKVAEAPAHKLQISDLIEEENPQAQAARLVNHLNTFPNDTEAREDLARLYADSFARLDLATAQMEILINLPTESPKRIAHWLNLLADLQVRCTAETQLAAVTLQRVIERFPNQPFAEVARMRLATLNQEVKRYEKSRVVKLGSQ